MNARGSHGRMMIKIIFRVNFSRPLLLRVLKTYDPEREPRSALAYRGEN